MRKIDADALMGPLKLQMESYRRIGETERAEAYANCLWEIAEAPTVGGWISVKDRLPEEASSVLVLEKQGFAFVDWYKFGVWQLGAENGAIITHWMPLPEPPKEDDDAGQRFDFEGGCAGFNQYVGKTRN